MFKSAHKCIFQVAAFVSFGTIGFANRLPPLLQDEFLFPGFAAIYQGDATAASASEIAIDAFYALQAIADNPADCIGANGTIVNFETTIETTTTNGFGLQTNSDTDVFESELHVRSEFAPWVRENIGFLRSNLMSGVRDGVSELITKNGCYSDEYARLEAGLATVFGVVLSPAAPIVVGDWETYTRACVANTVRSVTANGQNISPRVVAQICVCAEYAALETGDADFYTAVRTFDQTYSEPTPDNYSGVFTTCRQERQPKEIFERYETYIRENGL